MVNNKINDIKSILIQWGEENYRDFVWRRCKNPFHILIAEMMLHRTKAEQVSSIFLTFINKHPDPSSVAYLPENIILDELSSLGLNWRILKIRETSKIIHEVYNGSVPCQYEQLLALPGIGQYIAGAVLCIAFNKKSPLLDTNLVRIINRIFNLNKSNKNLKKQFDVINLLLSDNNIKNTLFSLLDFSAIICTPRNPRCNVCPIYDLCEYKKKILPI